MTTDNTLCALPAASTRLLLINSRLVCNSLNFSSTDHSPAYTDLFSRLASPTTAADHYWAHIGRAEYLSVAHLPASNLWLVNWLSARMTCRPSLTSSLICVLPWTTALHLARPTHPFVTATVLDPVTKPCELFPESLRFAAYVHIHELMSEAAASLQAETDGGNADESASPPASAPRWTAGWRRWSYWRPLLLPWFWWSVNNRLSRDDDRLLKKPSFTSLVDPRLQTTSDSGPN